MRPSRITVLVLKKKENTVLYCTSRFMYIVRVYRRLRVSGAVHVHKVGNTGLVGLMGLTSSSIPPAPPSRFSFSCSASFSFCSAELMTVSVASFFFSDSASADDDEDEDEEDDEAAGGGGALDPGDFLGGMTSADDDNL